MNFSNQWDSKRLLFDAGMKNTEVSLYGDKYVNIFASHVLSFMGM